MIRRLSKKWSALLFILLSVLLAGYGYVNSEADLLSKHNAITYKEWQKISAEELADALEKGEFNPDQLILRKTDNGLSISPAIVIATKRNQKEHLRLLLDYGAQVNLTDTLGLGLTALQVATWAGEVEIIEILLNYGAQVDFVNKAGLTALHVAALGRGKDSIEMLLKAGANPNIRFESDDILRNSTPLSFIFDRYVKGVKIVNEEEELKNIIALLVEKGADINAIDGDGNSLIHYVTGECKLDWIEYAVQMGAYVNQENNTYGTPLLRAVMFYQDTIPALLEAGADPNYVSSKGGVLTPLNVATMVLPNPAIVIQMLLDGGADINLDDGSALKHAKLRASGEYYKMHRLIYDLYVKKLPSNCALTRADFANKQSKEEWQRKGQEVVDMLLAHGVKDDANKQPVDDEAIANLTAIFAGFPRVRGIDHVR